MKKSLIAVGLATSLLSSCQTNTGTGALVGGGLGAGTGAIISGGTVEGTLIGGAVGAVAGGLVGAALDSQDRDNLQRNSPDTLRKIDEKHPLSVEDVKKMAKNGLSDQVIVGQIQATESVFHLTADQIVDLKRAGVSQNVIDYMIQTGNS